MTKFAPMMYAIIAQPKTAMGSSAYLVALITNIPILQAANYRHANTLGAMVRKTGDNK